MNHEDQVRDIVRQAIRATGTDAGGVIFPARHNRRGFAYLENLPDFLSGFFLSESVGLSARVMETNAPVVVEDYPSHPEALSIFLQIGLRSLIMLPVLAEGQAIAVLGVSTLRRGKTFMPKDVAALKRLARRLAKLLAEGAGDRLRNSDVAAAEDENRRGDQDRSRAGE